MSHPEHKPAPPQAYGIALEHGEALTAEELLQIPIFKGINPGWLARNAGAVVRRRFRRGEIVCREGEYGSTAFLILEGRARVFITSPISHVKTQSGTRRWLSRLTSSLATRRQDQREEEGRREFIPIDAPVDLTYNNPVAELQVDDLFGEMTCMSFYPRSATVRAEEDCVMLEMLRNILDQLRKNPAFKKQQDDAYRSRALESHLKSVPIFADLTPRFIEHLRNRVELDRYEPGQVICRQGEASDSLFLVRIGFVKVSQAHPGGELVLAYLPRGSCFGEIGLLGGSVRTATCTALDHVEVVKIKGDDFRIMVEEFPEVRRRLEQVAEVRRGQNFQRLQTIETVPLGDFLSQGLMEAQNLLVLDLEKCTRCDACVTACADAHDGITRLVREGLRFDKFLVATSCRQCRDPLCMVGCPVGSIRRRNSLEIIIEDWCIGCGLCAKNCPYGNINLHEFADVAAAETEVALAGAKVVKKAAVKKKATTCDLCTDQKEPSCVYACPHDAAHRIDPATFFSTVRGGSGKEIAGTGTNFEMTG